MAVPEAIDFGQGVSNAWANVANAIPKFVLAVVIFVIAYIVAKALSKITDKVLERVGFDRAVERGGIKQAMSKSKYDASDIVAKIVYYAVLLVGLSMAFGVFGPNPISNYLRSIIAYLPKVFAAIVIIVVAAAIAKAVNDLLSNVLGGLSYGSFLAKAASAFVVAIGIFAALEQLNIAQYIVGTTYTAIVVTVAGILIVGVGGGLVKPMQERWERMLNHAEQESGRVRQQAQSNATSSGATYGGSGASYGSDGTVTYPASGGSTSADVYDQGSTGQTRY